MKNIFILVLALFVSTANADVINAFTAEYDASQWEKTVNWNVDTFVDPLLDEPVSFNDDNTDVNNTAANHAEADKRVSLVVTEDKSFNDLLGDFQRQLITQAMEDNDHVWAKAARQLKLDRGNLYRQAKRLGLT